MARSGEPPPRQAQAIQFFLQRGWSPQAALGIVGNLIQESGPGLSTTVEGDEGTSVGIAQWRGERRRRLVRYAKQKDADWQDFGLQLAFVDHELRTTEREAARALRSAQSVPEAVDAFIGFERPHGWKRGDPSGAHGRAQRMANAGALASGSGIPFEGSLGQVLGLDPLPRRQPSLLLRQVLAERQAERSAPTVPAPDSPRRLPSISLEQTAPVAPDPVPVPELITRGIAERFRERLQNFA